MLAVIAVAQLMMMLDATIVNVALPKIQVSLSLSTPTLSWVVNVYALTAGGLLLIGGRVGDVLGRRTAFLAGITVFTLASLLGGLATNGWMLLAARGIQGVGTAMLGPAVLALLSSTFTEEEDRKRAFGVYVGVSSAGGAFGLLLGGILVEWLSWRSVLLVNVPLGIVVALLALRAALPAEKQPGRYDLGGALCSTAGMATLVYGFIHSAQSGWHNGLTIGSFVLAVLLLGGFILIEQRTSQPITPLYLFRNRDRASAYAIGLVLTSAFSGLFFFLTLFMQHVLNYRPLAAGAAFLPATVAILAAATVTSQKLLTRGPKPPMVIGLLLILASLAWLTRVDMHSGYATELLGPMILFGAGNGMIFVPLTMVGVSGVPPQESGAASSVLQATQQVGGSVGLAVLTAVYGAATDRRTGSPAAVFSHGTATAFAVAIVFVLVGAAVAIMVRPATAPGADQAAAPVDADAAAGQSA